MLRVRSDFSVGKTAGSCRGRAVSRLLVCEEGLWGLPDRLQGEDAVVSGKCYGDAGGLDLLMVPGCQIGVADVRRGWLRPGSL